MDVLITLAVNSSSTYAYNVITRDLYDLLLLAFQTVQISAAALQIQRFGKILVAEFARENEWYPMKEVFTKMSSSSQRGWVGGGGGGGVIFSLCSAIYNVGHDPSWRQLYLYIFSYIHKQMAVLHFLLRVPTQVSGQSLRLAPFALYLRASSAVVEARIPLGHSGNPL